MKDSYIDTMYYVHTVISRECLGVLGSLSEVLNTLLTHETFSEMKKELPNWVKPTQKLAMQRDQFLASVVSL